MSHCGLGWMQGEDLAAADWESLSDEDDDFLEWTCPGELRLYTKSSVNILLTSGMDCLTRCIA